MKRRYPQNRGLSLSKIRSSFPLLGMLTLWFFLLVSPSVIEATDANQSIPSFKEEAKRAIKTLTACLTDAVSKKNISNIQEGMDTLISDAEREGKPILFGIGILDKDAATVAGRYARGLFKQEDFSRYDFVKKAFKKKKIVQERLYFQDHSELLIICVPLVQSKKIIGVSVPLVQPKKIVGAIILGFNPIQVKNDYGLSTEQFLALDFNK
ncbi:MAG: hypothetical protein ACXU9K_06550 [Thermodesulfobacteriota bacterium]